MAIKSQFVIQFSGLSLGSHLFELEVNSKFFEQFESSEIQKGNIKIKLELVKQSSMLILNFQLAGSVNSACDRCNEDFDLPINAEDKLIVKFGNTEEESENDDIITLAPNENELDISQLVYEYIVLALPIRRVHSDNDKGESGCNKNTLAKLNSILLEKEKKEKTDPRWAALKNIKLNKN
jgi:uncharacterized protein